LVNRLDRSSMLVIADSILGSGPLPGGFAVGWTAFKPDVSQTSFAGKDSETESWDGLANP
jgi:hypothetical protein